MDEPTHRIDTPPDRVTALWRRAKEHRVAQWTVGYVAVAYGIQHAVVLTGEAFEWPQAAQRISMLVRKMGLVDYWKARGWPDLCHPVGADDFACE